MKFIKVIILAAMTTVAFAGEVPEQEMAKCECPTKSCPGYDSAICAHSNDRTTDNKDVKVKSKGKGKSETSSSQ